MEQNTGHTQAGSSTAAVAARAMPALGDGLHVSRSTIGGVAVVSALFVLVFWDFLWRQVRWAIEEQADWGHTLVIPFIAGYFVYLNRHRLMAAGFRTAWIGLVPIVLGVGWYIFTNVGPQALNHHNLKGAGFGLALFGVVLLFTGWRAMRYLFFPIVYLVVFGQTISNQLMHIVTFKMQDIAAVGSQFLLVVLSFDVTRDGNTIHLFYGGQEYPLNIAEACSGMRMLMAFLALAVAMGYSGFKRNWQRVLLVILAVPISIFVNMLRVVTLGFLSIYDTEFAAGDFHTFVGLVWLVPAFLIYLGAMWVVNKIVVEDESQKTEKTEQTISAPAKSVGGLFDARAKSAFFVCCAALLVTGLGFQVAVAQLNIYLRKQPVEMREQFTTIPRTLGGWHATGSDQQYDAAMVETLGTDVYLDRWYERTVDDSERTTSSRPVRMNVHLAYYTGMIDTVPHIPDRCMVAGGFRPAELPEILPLHVDRSAWRLDEQHINQRAGEPYQVVEFEHRITGRPVSVRMPIGDFRLRTTEFRHPGRGESRIFAGFFFIANHHVTASPLEVRRLAFDRTDKYAYYCKVQFLMDSPDLDRETFAAQVSDLLNELLPELMRALPDWADIEEDS